MRSDIVPGSTFPDYELPDENGKLRRLSELQGPDPMALMLARGGYCPKEHRQHVCMTALHPEIEVGYSRLVTISTDSILASYEWRHRLGAHWSSPINSGSCSAISTSPSTPIPSIIR